MNGEWKNAVVSKVAVAIYVAPGTGSVTHVDRPFHGFVLNDPLADKDYLFSDGSVMRTGGEELFYLPKGSSYRIAARNYSGCYAINFDLLAPLSDRPFTLRFRNTEPLFRLMRETVHLWQAHEPFYETAAIRAVYGLILAIAGEEARVYAPTTQESLILPACEMIRDGYTDPSLTVASLAAACGVSEVYLRRLFLRVYGVSPKEYVIGMRIRHAKELLASGQFSVSEVARLSGYSDATHFSRDFKMRVGAPPSLWR